MVEAGRDASGLVFITTRVSGKRGELGPNVGGSYVMYTTSYELHLPLLVPTSSTTHFLWDVRDYVTRDRLGLKDICLVTIS